MTGVSFVVPVRNGAALLPAAIASILAQMDGRAFEIVAVDDGSVDGSVALLEDLARSHPIRLVRRYGGGAAAAINAGVLQARHPIICQVDQDVRLHAGWLQVLLAELERPDVAAAQGYYTADHRAPLSSRVMGLDLEQRYADLGAHGSTAVDTDHACTGNTAYRAEALHHVGLFDETLGYGYDNDMSYRLRAAGYQLRLCPGAGSTHAWREGIAGYLRQQYGFGYGRMDVVAKHPARVTGDRVSPWAMMAHPLVMAAALAAMACGARLAGGALLGLLAVERAAAGVRAARHFRDRAAWLFPPFHLLRDTAWVAAIAMWTVRRLVSGSPRPSHSMRPRPATVFVPEPASAPALWPARASGLRIVGLIPAHNEAANLPVVIEDLRARHPQLDVLVIDDGSTDGTPALLEQLDVRSICFPERMGIGSAMRAGLRYAVRMGFDVAVRLDGDGQHGAADIEALLGPLRAGAADVVLGSRFASPDPGRRRAIRLFGPPLARCLTALTGRRVTDPTSGFCAFGPRAVRMLATHHPDGYAEPELRLFLSRNGLRVLEAPVRGRPRLSGSTSLTPGRTLVAAARLMLALVIVPLRAVVAEPSRD